jgi:hypothetical protein
VQASSAPSDIRSGDGSSAFSTVLEGVLWPQYGLTYGVWKGSKVRLYDRKKAKAWGDWSPTHQVRKFVSRGEGSGEGVDATLLSGTLYSIGLAEFATRARFRLRKTPWTCVHARARSVGMDGVLVWMLLCRQEHCIQWVSQNSKQGRGFICEKKPMNLCAGDSDRIENLDGPKKLSCCVWWTEVNTYINST